VGYDIYVCVCIYIYIYIYIIRRLKVKIRHSLTELGVVCVVAGEWEKPTLHARDPITIRRKYSWEIKDIKIGHHGWSKSRTSSCKNDIPQSHNKLYDVRVTLSSKVRV
jgi:hypothetical protein